MEFKLKGLLNLDTALTGALTAAEMKVAVATTIATSAMVVSGVDVEVKNRATLQIEIKETQDVQKVASQEIKKVAVPVQSNDSFSSVELPTSEAVFDQVAADIGRTMAVASNQISSTHAPKTSHAVNFGTTAKTSPTKASSSRRSSVRNQRTSSTSSRRGYQPASRAAVPFPRSEQGSASTAQPETVTSAPSTAEQIRDRNIASQPPKTGSSTSPDSSSSAATPGPAIVAPIAGGGSSSGSSGNTSGSSSSSSGSSGSSGSSSPNTAPTVSMTCSATVAQGSAISCASQPSAADPDSSDTQTWSFATGHDCLWASINSSTGALSGSPNDDEVGSCTLAIKSNDGSADSNIAALAITVTNSAPTLTIADATNINENSGVVTVRTNADIQADEEGFGLYSLVAATAPDCRNNEIFSGININTGRIDYQPATNYVGTCNFAVQFDDGNSSTVVDEFAVTVVAVNDAPTATDSCATTIAQDAPYSCSPVLTDADGPTQIWVLHASNTCAWASIDVNTGAITGTPNDDEVGACTIAYRVSDSLLNSPIYNVNVTVTNVAPTLTIADAFPIQMNSPALSVHVDGGVQADEEGFGTYSFDHATATSPKCDDNNLALSIDSNTGAVTYQPPADYAANCYIKVVFDDGNGGTAEDEFRILMWASDYRHNWRSVGAGSTAPIATGAANPVDINIGITLFDTAVPSNVGVGDILEYDTTTGLQGSTTKIAIIAYRIAPRVFILKNPDGTLVKDVVTDDTDWRILRAYTALADAENGTENTGINAALRDFDTWSGGRDLVTNNEIWKIAVYGDGPISGATFNGWTSSATNNLTLFAPKDTIHVGTSQRHEGTWDATKTRLHSTAGGLGIRNGVHFMNIEGLQFRFENVPSGNRYGISNEIIAGSTYETTINGNLFWGDPLNTTQTNHHGIRINSPNVSGGSVKISNNVIFDFNGTNDSAGIYVANNGTHNVYAHNNTIADNVYGAISAGGAHNIIMSNNAVSGSANSNFSGISDANARNNISSDGSSPGGTGNLLTTSLTYKDSANDDFSLAYDDFTAFRIGQDLSADANLPIAEDILGTSRGTVFDVGAFQMTNGPSCVADQVLRVDNAGAEVSHASIQDAINPAGSNIKVVVGSGVFEESPVIALKSQYKLISHCDATIRGSQIVGGSNITMYGFNIDVNGATQPGINLTTTGTAIIDIMNVKVSNAGTVASPFSGIFIDDQHTTLNLSEVESFNNTHSGIDFNGTGTGAIIVDNSHFHNNGHNGVVISNAQSGITISNTLIEDNGQEATASSKYGVLREPGGAAAAVDIVFQNTDIINNAGATGGSSTIDVNNYNLVFDGADSNNQTTGGTEGASVTTY